MILPSQVGTMVLSNRNKVPPSTPYDKCPSANESARWSGFGPKDNRWFVYHGDARSVLATLPADEYDCVVTSPPYYALRDYGVEEQIGQEHMVDEFVGALVVAMDGVYRVLKPEGLLFLNLGDTYYSGKGRSHGVDRKSAKRRFGLRPVDRSGGLGIGIRPKSIIGIPWRVALEMIKGKWVLRSSIIWHRKHALPEPVRDRPSRSYEYVLMFAKQRNYYFNRPALRDIELEEDVWTIAPRPKTNGVDTAPFPDELVRRCLELGCPSGGHVLDPFVGSGTTLRVALSIGRDATGIDLNPEFCAYAAKQCEQCHPRLPCI